MTSPLFDDAVLKPAREKQSTTAPLAARMRPESVDELAGQEHLLGEGSPLRQLIKGHSPVSAILWGPPGSGKTTIAHLISEADTRRLVTLSALSAGVKEVRAAIEDARRIRRGGGAHTVLFIDEIHRFSKTQQDSLLGAVEEGTVLLLAATTENPHFSVVAPLLSRCLVLTLHALTTENIATLLESAVTSPKGLNSAVTLLPEAREHFLRVSGGDARKALTALEAAAASLGGSGEIDLETAVRAVDVAAVRYDRDGDTHYDVTSALIKSLRGSDVDAALHYLARMIVAGEDPRFIARRLVIFASEDVGMADSSVLQTATAAATAVERIGLPEARLNLAHAVIHAATAPKSNAVITAVDEAINDVQRGNVGVVPPHLRDTHYAGAAKLGHGEEYAYPHDDPHGIVPQQYAPDEVREREYYRPTRHGAEKELAERVPRLREVLGRNDTE